MTKTIESNCIFLRLITAYYEEKEVTKKEFVLLHDKFFYYWLLIYILLLTYFFYIIKIDSNVSKDQEKNNLELNSICDIVEEFKKASLLIDQVKFKNNLFTNYAIQICIQRYFLDHSRFIFNFDI